jgi:Na+/melibiose symporter-like transporter
VTATRTIAATGVIDSEEGGKCGLRLRDEPLRDQGRHLARFAISALVLLIIGYSRETATDPGVVHGLNILFNFVPGALAAIAGLILLKYPIRDSQMKEIEHELLARKQASPAAAGG